MSLSREEILAAAESRRNLIVRLLTDLIRLNTTNPPGNEKLVADYLAEFCRERRIPFRTVDPGGARTSLIAEVGSGNSPTLLIPAHSDVVPAGDGWSVPPFQGVVKDGCVWGRGASDNKGPLAGLFAAVDFLKTIEGSLKGSLLAGALADEEHGSVLGMSWLLDKANLTADMAFVPDMTSHLEKVEIAEKGLVNVQVTFRGKQAHSSMPAEGVSALSALAELLYRTEHWLPHGSLRAHPLLTPTTCVATVAEAGVAHNVVPGKASVVYNLRFLPWQTAEGIVQELRTVAQEIAARRKGVNVTVEKITELGPSEVKPDAPVAQALFQAVQTIRGKTPAFVGVGGATLCKQLIRAGIPAVAFGPGDPHMPHMADEHVSIDELVTYTAIVIAATLSALNG